MVTNEQIRRVRPSIDSPLGRLISGEITEKEYQRQVEEKRARERDASSTSRQAADPR